MKEKKFDHNFSDLQKNRRRKKATAKIIVLSVAGVILIIGLIWLFFRIPFLYFDKIDVNLASEASKNEILDSLKQKLIGQSFINKSLGFNSFLIWPKQIAGADLNLSDIENIQIKKDYLSRALILDVLERKVVGIWCLRKEEPVVSDSSEAIPSESPSKCWFFDSKGEIFKESMSTGGNIIKVVDDYSPRKLEVGSKILPDEIIPNMLSILNLISGSGLDVKKIEIRDLNLMQVDASIYNGPVIYFSLRRDAANYLEVIRSLMQKKGFKNLNYIDLRVENRVYYK